MMIMKCSRMIPMKKNMEHIMEIHVKKNVAKDVKIHIKRQEKKYVEKMVDIV